MREDHPSVTAIKIARGLYSLAKVEPYVSVLPIGLGETTKALLEGAGLLEPWMDRVYDSRLYAKLLTLSDQFIPGATLHMALRKRVMDDLARHAIEQGASQLLVVGAGFDTLCVRLADEYPNIVAVEVDHPATHEPKARGVAKAGLLRPNLHLLSANLATEALENVLGGLPQWSVNARSFVVAEGLLMYLEEAAVRRLLSGIRAASGPGSQLAFSYVPADDRGRVGVELGWLLRTSLSAMGEAFQWGPRPGALAGFLAEEGFTLEGPDAIDLRARYLEPAGLGELEPTSGERVALART